MFDSIHATMCKKKISLLQQETRTPCWRQTTLSNSCWVGFGCLRRASCTQLYSVQTLVTSGGFNETTNQNRWYQRHCCMSDDECESIEWRKKGIKHIVEKQIVLNNCLFYTNRALLVWWKLFEFDAKMRRHVSLELNAPLHMDRTRPIPTPIAPSIQSHSHWTTNRQTDNKHRPEKNSHVCSFFVCVFDFTHSTTMYVVVSAMEHTNKHSRRKQL